MHALAQVSQSVARSKAQGTRQVTAMVGKGQFFVGGNWKCNETVAEAKQLVKELNDGDVPDDCEIIVAPTFIHLQMVYSPQTPPS
jgi:triosephosphate isomerase